MIKKNKVLLFYNPNSGNGMFKNHLDLIIERFQKKRIMVILIRADYKEIFNEVFKTLDQNEYKKIIVAGGDGTINILINAMISNNINLPLAIFPVGTANDFAYCFDIPNDIDGMLNIALEEYYINADIGKMNNKYFVNVASMGFLIDVSQKTDPIIKNTIGILSYYLKGVSEIPNMRPISIKITSEEYSSKDRVFFILVMNGRSAGGFKRIAPLAEINDGLLDVIIFKEMPIIDFAPLLIKVMTGQHTENKNVVFFHTQKLLIESDNQIGTDIDGEKGEELPLNIEVISSKIKVNTKLATYLSN